MPMWRTAFGTLMRCSSRSSIQRVMRMTHSFSQVSRVLSAEPDVTSAV